MAVPDAQLEAILRQLAAALRAGVAGPALLPGLLAAVPQALSAPLHKALVGGAPLSSSLAEARLITAAERALLEAGERSGRVPELLEVLAAAVAQRRKARTGALLALAYPAVLIALAGFLLSAPLAVTRGIGGWLAIAIWPAVLVALAAVLALLVWPRLPKSSSLRAWPQRLVLALPLLGPGLARGALATFCEVLAELVAAGVPYTLSLPTALDASGHPALVGAGPRVVARIEGGASLSDALRSLGALPERLLVLLSTAERSGTVDGTLRHSGAEERDAYRRCLHALIAALSLLAFLVVGVAVGATIIGGAQGYLEQVDDLTAPER